MDTMRLNETKNGSEHMRTYLYSMIYRMAQALLLL